MNSTKWTNIIKNTDYGGISVSTSSQYLWGSYEATTTTTFAGQITSVSSFSSGSKAVGINTVANPAFWNNQTIFNNPNFTDTEKVVLAEDQAKWELQTFGNIGGFESTDPGGVKGIGLGGSAGLALDGQISVLYVYDSYGNEGILLTGGIGGGLGASGGALYAEFPDNDKIWELGTEVEIGIGFGALGSFLNMKFPDNGEICVPGVLVGGLSCLQERK